MNLFVWKKLQLKADFVLAYFLLILRIAAEGEGQGVEEGESKVKLIGFQDSVDALEKAVGFYSKDYDKVNLDSIFGLRVCQGVLHRAILLSKRKKENGRQIERIEKLHYTVSNIAQNGYNSLKSSKSDYAQKFDFLINDEWIFMLPYSVYDRTLINPNDVILEDLLDEATSDVCMTDLVGNKEEASPISCVITNHCWDVMSAKSMGGYHLTHQALFVMLAEKQGCRAHVIEKLGSEKALTKHMSYLGSNIFHQMEQKYRQGLSSGSDDKDLFVEQIIVCQMLGITDCFDSKYLSLIIDWQDESGCWKEKKHHDGDDDDDEQGKQTGGVFNDSNDGKTMSRLSSRTLNEEKILKDGCASHFTGVATGALAMFTFWYLHPHVNQSDSAELDTLSMIGRRFHGTGDQGFITGIIFDFKWPIVFVIVSLFVYLCRKLTRRHFSRRYTKLVI